MRRGLILTMVHDQQEADDSTDDVSGISAMMVHVNAPWWDVQKKQLKTERPGAFSKVYRGANNKHCRKSKYGRSGVNPKFWLQTNVFFLSGGVNGQHADVPQQSNHELTRILIGPIPREM